MAKKVFLVLIIATLVTGGVFAQALNTVTVDFGPTIVGALIGQIGSVIESLGDDIETSGSSGFGIGAQYERQISNLLSVAGRFAYLGGGMGLVYGDGPISARPDMSIRSFSVEGHARLYPLGDTFFFNGMLGYGNLSTSVSGTIEADVFGVPVVQPVNATASRSYAKFGAKLGWRISFGSSGGFTFEPAIGYYGAMGLGKTLGDQIIDSLPEEAEGLGGADDMLKAIENYVFIGGPRLTLSLGYRF